jgi:hypothetical protein
MLGELLGTMQFPYTAGVGFFRCEAVALCVFRVIRTTGTTNSLTILVEVVDDDNTTVLDSQLFAVRSAGEWDGELYAIADLFTENFSAGATSIFNWVAEARQINCGNVRTDASLSDTYPVDAGSSSLFYHLRGLRAQCRRSTIVAAMDAQGVHTIRQPKLAIFRNPVTYAKRWFVRSRIFYQENWVVPLESLQLAPSGNNTVTAPDAIGNFPIGTVYTGDEHPEIDLNGTRRAAAIQHTERGTIEPFYFLANLVGGRGLRVTVRELADNMTGEPVMTNTYPSNGTARSDESVVGTGPTFSQFSITGHIFAVTTQTETITETDL